MGSGRRLLIAMLVLVACDVIGGFIAALTNVNSWSEAWGFDAKGTVPIPVAATQLLMAWLAARNVRPRLGLFAARLLAIFCAISLLAGMFDGDLISNITSDGLSPSVAWAGVLLAATAVVGVFAFQRARDLRNADAHSD